MLKPSQVKPEVYLVATWNETLEWKACGLSGAEELTFPNRFVSKLSGIVGVVADGCGMDVNGVSDASWTVEKERAKKAVIKLRKAGVKARWCNLTKEEIEEAVEDYSCEVKATQLRHDSRRSEEAGTPLRFTTQLRHDSRRSKSRK